MENIRRLARLARGNAKVRSNKINSRINSLVAKGYTEAGFENRENANAFGNAWQAKGYKVHGIRSSGPTVENPNKRTMNAFYVIAEKPKRKR